MAPRGMSHDEKRRRLEELFHETKDFFNLKEVEKAAYTKKKIILQAVKDVLLELIGDGLVKAEKIGSANFYWSFPSDAKISRTTRLSQIESQNKALVDKIDTIRSQIEDIKAAQPKNHDEKVKKIKEIDQKRELAAQIKERCKKLLDKKEAQYKIKKLHIPVAKEAVNRWTENIWAIESFLTQKMQVNREDIEMQFEIDPEMDTYD